LLAEEDGGVHHHPPCVDASGPLDVVSSLNHSLWMLWLLIMHCVSPLTKAFGERALYSHLMCHII
jgi:hypothetical protein